MELSHPTLATFLMVSNTNNEVLQVRVFWQGRNSEVAMDGHARLKLVIVGS